MCPEVFIDLATQPKDEKVELDQIITHQRVHVSSVAQFAMGLMNVGMLQPCVPDGEDSGGTRQYRMLTEQEVVVRAIKIAETAFSTFLERGWAAEAPPLDALRRRELKSMGFVPRADGKVA